MAKSRSVGATWLKLLNRNMSRMTGMAIRAGTRSATQALKVKSKTQRKTKPVAVRKPTTTGTRPAAARAADGTWLLGLAAGVGGVRRYRVFRPGDIGLAERLPLMVMLHGCMQDAEGFAAITRMNLLATRERFLVLYPEQDRLSNANGCWNWFETRSGKAQAEARLIVQAVDQVCSLYGADPARVAVAGLSAGASMAALLGTHHPSRFRAVVMHSGVPPGAAHSTASAVGAMSGRRHAVPAPTAPASDGAPWPPLLVIQGGADAVVNVRNGRAAAELWAHAAGATATAERMLRRGQRYPMQVTDFKQRSSVVATLVEIPRLGHAWSGGRPGQRYSDPQGADATAMAWRFAARQFGALAGVADKRSAA